MIILYLSFFFFSTPTPPPEIYTLSLHDALPISRSISFSMCSAAGKKSPQARTHRVQNRLVDRITSRSQRRSEEHTSELQSRFDLVCRLLLEKKKRNKI